VEGEELSAAVAGGGAGGERPHQHPHEPGNGKSWRASERSE
jgi:hypothetical protein